MENEISTNLYVHGISFVDEISDIHHSLKHFECLIFVRKYIYKMTGNSKMTRVSAVQRK